MIGIVVVAHGKIAEEMVKAVHKIVPDAKHITGVSIDSDDKPENLCKHIESAVKKVKSNNGVLILSDMFGGTPTNMCLSFLEPGNVEVVSGVNLPMLIKLASIKENDSLSETVSFIQEYGKKHIVAAGMLLTSKKKGD
jgi:mannose PTS system EIIA component